MAITVTNSAGIDLTSTRTLGRLLRQATNMITILPSLSKKTSLSMVYWNECSVLLTYDSLLPADRKGNIKLTKPKHSDEACSPFGLVTRVNTEFASNFTS